MAVIDVKRVVEIAVDMKLNERDASELLYHLRSGLTPPQVQCMPGEGSDIVRQLADALIAKGVK